MRSVAVTTSAHAIKELRDVFSVNDVDGSLENNNGLQFVSQEFSPFFYLFMDLCTQHQAHI